METILASVSEYLVAFLVVFVVLFVIVSYFFTGKKLIDTVRGFFLVIASIFYSPLVYFQKSLMAVAHFRLREAGENEDTRQYLLVRFLTALQALLAIIVVGAIASGGIKAWDSFLPPKYAREENARLEKTFDNLETEFAKLNPEVTGMDTNWTNSKQVLINSYRKEQDAKAAKASADNSSVDQQITNAGAMPAFLPIKRYLDQSQHQASITRYDNIKKEALDYIKNQDIPAESKQLTNTYIENWHILMTVNYEESNFSEEQYRTRIQPDYLAKKANLSNLENEITFTKEQLKNLQPALKYNPISFFLLLLGTLLTVFLLIWFVGLIIELLWLGVDIAGNVNRIRTLKQNV
jgi:hypothetical protein